MFIFFDSLYHYSTLGKRVVGLSSLAVIMITVVGTLILFAKNSDYLIEPFADKYIDNNLEKPNIVVLGIDGLSWDMLNSMIENGELPNLNFLLNSGSYAPLHTFKPTSSPYIWNSIYTGYNPETHKKRPQVITLPFYTIYKRNNCALPDIYQLGATLFSSNRKITKYPLAF